MADPAVDPPPGLRALRGLLVALFGLGTLVGLVYASSLPNWALEDEPQHLDYAARLAEGSVPAIDDRLDPSIIDALFADDRWQAYGQVTPPSPAPEDMGLAGYSYLGYHPPLGYGVLAAVHAVVPGSPADHLAAGRLLSALSLGLACAGTAALAARLAAWPDRAAAGGRRSRRAALGAGVALAALPVAGDAAGRVNTDGFAMLAVLAVLGALIRWWDQPGRGRALLVGLALAAAVLTRETALVAAVPVAVALGHAAWHRRLRPVQAMLVVVPPVVAGLTWSALVWARYGAVGSDVFVEAYGAPFAPPRYRAIARALVERTLLPWGDWSLPVVASWAVVALVAAGLVLAARAGLGRATVVALAMAAVQVAVVGWGAATGFSTVTGRLLLPVAPVLVALASVGWCSGRSRWAAVAWTGALAAFGLAFLVVDQLPRYGLV